MIELLLKTFVRSVMYMIPLARGIFDNVAVPLYYLPLPPRTGISRFCGPVE